MISGIERADAFRGPDRYVELDIGNAERDAPEARGVRLVAAHAIAPGADGLDMVVVLAECERGAFQLLRDRRQPLKQRLAPGDDDSGMAAKHLRRAVRQMKLALADIDPHVGVRHHQIGIAGQPEAGDIEQRRQPLIGHRDVDVLEMDRVAEVFCGAVELAVAWMRSSDGPTVTVVGGAKRAHHTFSGSRWWADAARLCPSTNWVLTSTDSPATNSALSSQTPACWPAGRRCRFPA